MFMFIMSCGYTNGKLVRIALGRQYLAYSVCTFVRQREGAV